jgi:hypothetical protein
MLHTLIDVFFEQSSPEMCSLRESLKVECDTREANVNLTVYTVWHKFDTLDKTFLLKKYLPRRLCMYVIQLCLI